MDVKDMKITCKKKLSKDETDVLIELAKLGDIEARNKIIEHNLWVVGTVNSKLGNTDDGIQQGILGLIEAIEKYKTNENTKFSTYAYFWVQQKILRYRDKNMYKANHNLIALYKKLQKFSGTKEEFYEKENLSSSIRIALNNLSSKGDYELTHERDMEDMSSQDEIDRFIQKDYVDNMLRRYCTDKEEYIIRKIFFTPNGEKELAKEFKCSRQYINTVKQRILSKLRGVIFEDYHN